MFSPNSLESTASSNKNQLKAKVLKIFLFEQWLGL